MSVLLCAPWVLVLGGTFMIWSLCDACFFISQILGYADYAFTSIFTVEILLKVRSPQ